MEGKTQNSGKAKFTPEQLKGWEDYRSSIYEQQTKSHDLFEKAMTFLSSGALGLTLTFHDKIVPGYDVKGIVFIAIGWLLLAATLFLNLLSHYRSSKSLNKSADEIDKVLSYKMTFEVYSQNLENRNKVIDRLNKITIWLLGIGIASVILYVTININNEKKTQPIPETQTTEQGTTQDEHQRTERPIHTTTNITIK